MKAKQKRDVVDSNNESDIFSPNEFRKHRGSSLGLLSFATPEHQLVLAAPLQQGRGRRCRPASLESRRVLVFKSVSRESFA